jgi:hypothetical protein
MDQTKLFGSLANDVSGGKTEPEAAGGAREIRSLSDLELTFAAGGDGAVIWNPPPKPELP